MIQDQQVTMIIGKEVLIIKNQLYLINRKIKETQQIDLDYWKVITGADRVFRSQGYYFFVEEIIDIEFEEIPLEKSN